MDLYTITIFIGILTYLSLVLTFLIGIRVLKVSFKIHKIFAMVTLGLASMHALFFIYLNFFE